MWLYSDFLSGLFPSDMKASIPNFSLGVLTNSGMVTTNKFKLIIKKIIINLNQRPIFSAPAGLAGN